MRVFLYFWEKVQFFVASNNITLFDDDADILVVFSEFSSQNWASSCITLIYWVRLIKKTIGITLRRLSEFFNGCYVAWYVRHYYWITYRVESEWNIRMYSSWIKNSSIKNTAHRTWSFNQKFKQTIWDCSFSRSVPFFTYVLKCIF